MAAWILLLVPAVVAAQNLILLGGAVTDNSTLIWNRLILLAGGRGVARIGIISAAEQTSEECENLINSFSAVYGAASAVRIAVTADNNDDPATAQLIENQSGIVIIDDGDIRLSLIQTLRPDGVDSLALMAVRNAMRSGAVVAGDGGFMSNSAVIVSGTTWSALMMGSFATDAADAVDESNLMKLKYIPRGGLGLFANGYVVDSRFSELGREGRLIRLLHDTRHLPVIGTTKGIGIDENVALVITDSFTKSKAEVVGTSGGVFYVDVANLQPHANATFGFDNLPINFLSVDDKMDLSTNEVSYADWKSALAGEEWFDKAVPSMDIFSDTKGGQWRKTAKKLVDCKNDFVIINYSIEARQPQFQVVFDRSQSVAYGSDLPNTTNFVASYKNLLVSIKPLLPNDRMIHS